MPELSAEGLPDNRARKKELEKVYTKPERRLGMEAVDSLKRLNIPNIEAYTVVDTGGLRIYTCGHVPEEGRLNNSALIVPLRDFYVPEIQLA